MTWIVGPYLAACLLLAGGGVLKAAKPADTATALRAAGLPISRSVVRLLGGAEAALGVLALATGSAPAAALAAVSYLTFAGFVAYALVRKLPLSSCGCLGSIDTPPTPLHVVLNLAAGALAAAATTNPPGSLASVLADQPLGGVPFVLMVPAVAYLTALAMSELPRARSLRVRRTA